MRIFIAIFLSLQFFTNHEAFAEMVKLPFLFDHYNETANNTAFIDFLKSHYSDNHHQDHDHGKLPFKHSDDGCTHHPSPNISVVVKSENNYSLKLIEFTVQNVVNRNDRISVSFIDNIWQPPKLA
jgi:hypothetical protein